MSAWGTGVGKGWQNDFDSGLFQKLLFPTRTARPVIQRWHVKSCWGCWEWWLVCVVCGCCAHGLVPAPVLEHRHCNLDLPHHWINHPEMRKSYKIPCGTCANRCTPSWFSLFCHKTNVRRRREGWREAEWWGHCSRTWNNRRPLASTSGQPKPLTKDTELTHNELLQWEGRL